jgi:hypothetical protein
MFIDIDLSLSEKMEHHSIHGLIIAIPTKVAG